MRHLPLYIRLFLHLILREDHRRSVMSDLSELYQVRWERDGEAAARAWLRRQTRLYPFTLIGAHLRRREPSHDSRLTTHSPPTEHLRTLSRDLRHSLRSLMRTPMLTATIVLTVGLGIGATTAIFSVIDAVLIRPLPYSNPGDLVRIYTDQPPNRWPFSVADYLALEEQQTSFRGIAAYWNATMTFTRDDVAERVQGSSVTWNYLSLLGINPIVGRQFNEADGVPGAERVALVSHGFWTRHLARDHAAIGRPIRLNGNDFTVVGVLPRDPGPLEYQREFFITEPLQTPPRKGPFFMRVVGRLHENAEVASAAEELRAINRRIFPIWQSSWQDETTTWGMVDLKAFVVGDVSSTLAIVLGAVGFVLLIACTNAANLLIARATHRSRELAVRAALGASRGRVLQHLLSESVLLAIGGASVGLLLTVGGIQLLATAGADFIPRSAEISINSSVLWFLTTVTLGSAVLFGLVPSLHGSRTRFEAALKSGGRGATDGTGPRYLRRALVISQFAIAAPLLIGAGLLVASLAKLQRVDPGFDTSNLLTAAISLPAVAYADTSAVRTFWDQFQARVEALPGVEGVGFANARPPTQLNEINNFNLEDHPTPRGEIQPTAPWVNGSPEYFDVLGISLIRGRMFDDRDWTSGDPVVLVDETWASHFFPNESAVGKRLGDGGSPDWTTIIGVVSKVKYLGLDNPNADGTVYRPIPPSGSRFRYFFVRTALDPFSVLPAVRQIVRELDSSLPVSGVATADELMADSLQQPRYLAVLVGAFAMVALLLSLIGIYGVMAYFVQQHTRDIGIRIALGGGPSDVMRLVVRQGMHLVVVGTALGVIAALGLTRYMSALLFEVGATDAATFAIVSLGMLGTAVIACFGPARRAAGLDPARTLREE